MLPPQICYLIVNYSVCSQLYDSMSPRNLYENTEDASIKDAKLISVLPLGGGKSLITFGIFVAVNADRGGEFLREEVTNKN